MAVVWVEDRCTAWILLQVGTEGGACSPRWSISSFQNCLKSSGLRGYVGFSPSVSRLYFWLCFESCPCCPPYRQRCWMVPLLFSLEDTMSVIPNVDSSEHGSLNWISYLLVLIAFRLSCHSAFVIREESSPQQKLFTETRLMTLFQRVCASLRH